MLREIYIDKYNKIINNFKPELFNSLFITQSKPYNKEVELFQVIDQHQQNYQLYLSKKPLEPVLNEIQFIEATPKILLFKTQQENIILEEHIEETLYEYMIRNQENYSHFMVMGDEKESFAKKVLRGVGRSLANYVEHNIDYNCINPRNIVRKNIEWDLSVAGLLLKNEKDSDDYYKRGIEKEFKHTYALGTLLFKMLFGFVPYEKKRQFLKFNWKSYANYLDKEENKKFLKVYSFADGLLDISKQAQELIELALSGSMTLENFFNHRFFSEDSKIKARREVSPGAREIRMLSLFEQANQSLILASIEHRKKFPQEKINAKLIPAFELTRDETIQHIRKHPLLYEIEFDGRFKDQKDHGKMPSIEEELPRMNINYFYREDDFDQELDLPCRQLMKFIETSVARKGLGQEEAQHFEEQIKLYAFPYAVVFELIKVNNAQPVDIQRKIYRLSEDLLQISQLNSIKQIMPLHDTQLVIKEFDDIKIRFRELLNDLYKYFLNESIRKYNVKKQLLSANERAHSKAQGLQYYKLCLKLMECSVLNRKKGRELDLQRIETSTRKEVEADLNQLLKQYFPTKIEHF